MYGTIGTYLPTYLLYYIITKADTYLAQSLEKIIPLSINQGCFLTGLPLPWSPENYCFFYIFITICFTLGPAPSGHQEVWPNPGQVLGDPSHPATHSPIRHSDLRQDEGDSLLR